MTMNEVERAQRELDESNERLERAFDHLIDKIEIQTERVRNLAYRAQAPVRFSKRNPEYVAAAVLFIGFFMGRYVKRKAFGRRRRYGPVRPAVPIQPTVVRQPSGAEELRYVFRR